MREDSMCKSRATGFADPVYRYILAAAGIIVLYISLGRYAQSLYEHCLIIPCLLLLGAIRERRTGLKYWKRFLLPLAMIVWFLILQIKRSIVYDEVYNVGLFLSTYLFAFPLASILDDGDPEKALKVFALAYLAAASLLAVWGLLLVLGCLPAFLSETVCWDGARLQMVWHPNVAACFLMIGVIFGSTFMSQAKFKWERFGLGTVMAVLLGTMALTNCRTAIILTGGYLGMVVFLGVIKRGKKWLLPGAFAILAVTAAFYTAAGTLYQMNHDKLLEQYSQQYVQQIEVEDTNQESETRADDDQNQVNHDELLEQGSQQHVQQTEVEDTNQESETKTDDQTDPPAVQENSGNEEKEETIPLQVDADTGEVRLIVQSAQDTMKKDLGTLNNRTRIWSAAIFALRESRDVLLWGIGNPGWYVSFYTSYPIGHLHNSWLECLVGLGLAGFLMALLFTLFTVWNCLVILCKHYSDIWRRNVALLTLCLIGVSFLQSYLFYSPVRHHPFDFMFFLCSGYLVHWQAEDNRRILAAVRSRFSFLK